MYRYKKIIHILVFLMIIAFTYKSGLTTPFTTVDMSKLSQDKEVAVKSDNPLYDEITQKSTDFKEPPEDAHIDKVWKKMPGRNGLSVDVDASYDQMKETGDFDENLLVYEQIPPEVRFTDLQAAPVYRGHPDKNMVSLLINVSWGDEHIPEILSVLKEHSVKATFFIEGNWAKQNVEYVEMIQEQGHLIGNHAYSHPDMERLSTTKINEELKQTNDVLEAITDETPEWFAPPSGSYNESVVKTAHDMDMETVLWTVDTIDWKNPSVSVMTDRVISSVHKGATILMHPTQVVAQGLDPMISKLKAQNYEIGTIDQLMNEKRIISE